MTTTRKVLATVALVLALSACTPQEINWWVFHPVGGDALVTQANRIAMCESTMNPGAVSPGGGNHGLFQINSVHRARFADTWHLRYDPLHNAVMAREIYQEQGWQPWSCRRAVR